MKRAKPVTGAARPKRRRKNAVKKLRRSLKALDIDVVLEKMAVSSSAFSKDPLESNRIWIAGKPIEEWLRSHDRQEPVQRAVRGCLSAGRSRLMGGPMKRFPVN